MSLSNCTQHHIAHTESDSRQLHTTYRVKKIVVTPASADGA